MARTLAPITALLISVAFMMIGHGLQTTIIPLAAETYQFSNIFIGAASSSYFVGMVIGALVAPFAILRAGHIRAFAALVSSGSAAALMHAMIKDPIAWLVFRGITGFCIAGFYLVIESWLNEKATNQNRGFIMSIYIVVSYAALVGGQLMAALHEPSDFLLFAVTSVVISFAVVPMSLTRANQPAPIALVRFRPKRLYRTSPTAIVSCMCVGAMLGTLWMLAPIYATGVGLTIEQAPFFAGAVVLGGVLTQWPIGRLSDSIDRRLVLIALCLTGGALALFIAMADGFSFYMYLGLALCIGGALQPAYSIALAHGYDHADSDGYVEMASGLMVVYAVGSAVGPVVASSLIDVIGPGAIFYFVFVVCSFIVVYLMVRIQARVAPTGEDKGDFDMASTAPVVGAAVTPELISEEDEHVETPQTWRQEQGHPS
ncbi:MFS transporter [Coralliovum pocilloporae]|uniref:MFS transporter n=1 Tax=Coralliovum pocilloporae TaxID=3066369 RepID=UPI003306C597